MNILFVCTGNTCRSPMAQAILQNKSDYNVKSAGIFAADGMPVSEETKQVLQQQGIPIDHQSQATSRELMDWAEIVLSMTQNHRDTLKQHYPEAAEKIFTLKEYANPEYEKWWREAKKLYADIEEKKLASQEPAPSTLHKVTELEKKLQDIDIIDPFGGNVTIYQKTYEELEKYLALLVKKLDNRHS